MPNPTACSSSRRARRSPSCTRYPSGRSEVGRKRVKLDRKGIYTVGELAALGETRLRSLLGDAAGAHLYALAMGHDPRPVTPSEDDAKESISREQTFFDPISRPEADKVLLYLTHDVARDCAPTRSSPGRLGSECVRLLILSTISRSLTLGAPTNLAANIVAARQLLEGISVPDGGIRLIGVKADNLADPEEGVQLSLIDDGRRGKVEGDGLGALAVRYGSARVRS